MGYVLYVEAVWRTTHSSRIHRNGTHDILHQPHTLLRIQCHRSEYSPTTSPCYSPPSSFTSSASHRSQPIPPLPSPSLPTLSQPQHAPTGSSAPTQPFQNSTHHVPLWPLRRPSSIIATHLHLLTAHWSVSAWTMSCSLGIRLYTVKLRLSTTVVRSSRRERVGKGRTSVRLGGSWVCILMENRVLWYVHLSSPSLVLRKFVWCRQMWENKRRSDEMLISWLQWKVYDRHSLGRIQRDDLQRQRSAFESSRLATDWSAN